jgi:proteasome lid subunit RPN8/RPN11
MRAKGEQTLSYVSIWKPVKDRIVQAAKETKTEIIGLLLGRLQDDTIVIEDSTTGEYSSEPHRVTLPASSIARIADELVKGRLKGNIVGWYHSHTEGGLFFSETDIATQKRLQQFSSLITGIVVDTSTGEVGYFRVAPGTDEAIRINDANVTVFEDLRQATLRPPQPMPIIQPTPTVEVRRRPPREQLLTKRLVVSLVLLVLIVSVALLGILVYTGLPKETTVTIHHEPISEATIGTPIEISANVTGPGHNVTLVYGLAAGGPLTQVMMASTIAGEYSYQIPGNQVTGNIAYYIRASDGSGREVNTSTYHIPVADFNLQLQTTSLTLYRTQYALSELQLLPLNNFNQQLSLSSTGNPSGLTVTFSENPAPPGALVSLNVTADATTPNGTYPIVLTATYLPAQSSPVSHQTTLMVTVTDFDLQIEPTSKTISPGSTTTFNVTLTLEEGFVGPVRVSSLQGLPQGATYTLTTSNPTVLGGGPGTTAVTLQIKVPTSTKAGTYPIVVDALGEGITHSLTIQLIVR